MFSKYKTKVHDPFKGVPKKANHQPPQVDNFIDPNNSIKVLVSTKHVPDEILPLEIKDNKHNIPVEKMFSEE